MTPINQERANFETYHIYGRKAYTEALSFIDEFHIVDRSALKTEAKNRFGERDWVELIAFPAKAAIQVIPRERDQCLA